MIIDKIKKRQSVQNNRKANIDILKRTLKQKVRDVLRKRNSSFAVVLPVVSIKNSGYYDDTSTYEKDFF